MCLASWVSECRIFVFNLTPLASYSYSSYFHLCGSGFTKFLNTDPNWIRIHKIMLTQDNRPEHKHCSTYAALTSV